MRAEIDHYFAYSLSLRSELKKLDKSKDANTMKFKNSYKRVSMTYYDQAKMQVALKLEEPGPEGEDIIVGFECLIEQTIFSLSATRRLPNVPKEVSRLATQRFFKGFYAAALWCLTSNGNEIVPIQCGNVKRYRRSLIRLLKVIRKELRKTTFKSKLEAMRFFEKQTTKEALKQWESVLK